MQKVFVLLATSFLSSMVLASNPNDVLNHLPTGNSISASNVSNDTIVLADATQSASQPAVEQPAADESAPVADQKADKPHKSHHKKHHKKNKKHACGHKA